MGEPTEFACAGAGGVGEVVSADVGDGELGVSVGRCCEQD